MTFISPKGTVSSEIVIYKDQRHTVPSDQGNWYIRWDEGSKRSGSEPEASACAGVEA
jgi:hypothetical protein